MPTFADRLLHFLTTFPLPGTLPDGVEARSPFREPAVHDLLRQFAQKFYADNQPRVAVLGINPGRLGMGRTGVAFTDPAALTEFCGIAHDLPRQRPETSTQFVYKVITEMGGPAAFYQHFYLGSLYPLVLLKSGLNYNYYDSPALTKVLWPDIQRSLRQQVKTLGLRRDVAVSLGKRNGEFFKRLNAELGLFDEIVVLDHPRYLMQYKSRSMEANVAHYVEKLGRYLSNS
ncbi:uracil-DNA glycosylase family protein [Hymenobacter terricola]|uniref:uracil-DNA glycosylase family protein n=1 Tax=Hymenobacter terricola TaxID=2819236 RepID=UPI001B3074DD|nr:uracil-DNA glycosylase family protein [Hymenobacter terricola]